MKWGNCSHGAVSPCLQKDASRSPSTQRGGYNRERKRTNRKQTKKTKESVIEPSSTIVIFVAFSKAPSFLTFKYIFEGSEKICVEGIRPVRLCGKVAPVLVHPEPRRRVLSHIRFK